MALGWLWWRAWVSVDAVDAAPLGVAGVALGDMDLHFAWQAWHLVTWIVTLRGRRLWHWAGSGGALGSQLTLWTPRLFVALGGMDRHFPWQAWHLWHWAGSVLGDIERRFCVAGVALMALGLALVACLGPS